MNNRKNLYWVNRRLGYFLLFLLLLSCLGAIALLYYRHYNISKDEIDQLINERETALTQYMNELKKTSEQMAPVVGTAPNNLDPLFILNHDGIMNSLEVTNEKNEMLYEYHIDKNKPDLYFYTVTVDDMKFTYGLDVGAYVKRHQPDHLHLNVMPVCEMPPSFDYGITRTRTLLDGEMILYVHQSRLQLLKCFLSRYCISLIAILGIGFLIHYFFQWYSFWRYKKAYQLFSEQIRSWQSMGFEEVLERIVDSPYEETYAILTYFKQFCENNKVRVDNQLKSLQHEVEQARYSSRSKTLYLANMSHEMRTPLNSVIGYTQLIEKYGYENSEKVKEYIGHIRKSSDILLQKINDILDLAKIEANQFELDTSPQNIRLLVKEVYDLLLISANKKGIDFYYSIDPQIPHYLMIDPTRFKQILINLCSNAIKYTHQGFVKLEIEVFGYVNDAVILEYRVQDTGVGIKQEDLQRIFIPFVQVGTPPKGYKGTGLGLTITRDLIKLMGGEIQVSSQENVGTTFTFTTFFRIAESEGNVEEVEVPDDQIADIIKGRKILVVEDNPINQMLIREIFKVFQKSDIDLAEDGLEAVNMCEKNQYDIIFMDIQMPRCDGVEATLKLREMERYNRVPIIALTANAFTEQVNEYLSLGMNDYLQKPLDIVRLKQVLVTFLST